MHSKSLQGMQPALTAEQEAYVHLLSAIRTRRYSPGDRLVPEEIAAEIGMSRMPVREAFRRLATEGLVVIRPNRGCTVSGLSLEEIYEVFEIRSVLEGLALRVAMPRIDTAVLSDLDRLLALMESSDDTGNPDWIEFHSRFHERIYTLSNRPKLIRQINTLQISIEPYLRVYFHHAIKSRSADAAHRELIAAVRTGNPLLAEEAMRGHILGTATLLANFIGSANSKTDTPGSSKKARAGSKRVA
jgi:DNA-binding GntR family transcriptional regulator